MQIRRIKEGEFPGDPGVRTIGFHCWAHGFNHSLFGKLRPGVAGERGWGVVKIDENNQVWVFPDEGVVVSDTISHVTYHRSYRLRWRILGHVVACRPSVTGKWWELPHGRGRVPSLASTSASGPGRIRICLPFCLRRGRRSPSELGREIIYSRIDDLTSSTYYCIKKLYYLTCMEYYYSIVVLLSH